MYSTFGERLKAIRTDREMSQDEFADLLGTTKQVISRYEKNQRTPKITTVNDFSVRLGVPLTYFIGGEEEGATLVSEGGPSASERALIDLFRLVPREQQDMILGMVEAALKSQGLL